MWIDDQVLARCAEPVALNVWVPESSMVVLGNANDALFEADVEACAADGIPVLKRYGGGGAVVLYPGCVVLSVGTWVKSSFDNSRYFRLINQALTDALITVLPAGIEVTQRGISDLCIGERKFAGTSLFRSKNYLLYQASMICNLDVEVISKYLKHPTKEPDYRGKRSHKDFLVGLRDVSVALTPAVVKSALDGGFSTYLAQSLMGDLIPSQSAQFANLEARRKRG